MARAPRLPPEMSTVSFFGSRPKDAAPCSRCAESTSLRIGLPVKTTLYAGKCFMASSVPAAIFVTNFERILLVMPGTTFCSWMSVGMCMRLAASRIGPQT